MDLPTDRPARVILLQKNLNWLLRIMKQSLLETPLEHALSAKDINIQFSSRVAIQRR